MIEWEWKPGKDSTKDFDDLFNDFLFIFLPVNDLGGIGMRVEARKELAVGCQIAPSPNITPEIENRQTVAQEIALYRKIVNLGGSLTSRL